MGWTIRYTILKKIRKIRFGSVLDQRKKLSSECKTFSFDAENSDFASHEGNSLRTNRTPLEKVGRNFLISFFHHSHPSHTPPRRGAQNMSHNIDFPSLSVLHHCSNYSTLSHLKLERNEIDIVVHFVFII